MVPQALSGDRLRHNGGMSIGELVAGALGVEVVAASGLRGGDVAESYRVELADGRRVFAKTKAGAAPEFFDTEARGLRWLAAADALAVPAVLAVGNAPPFLVLEWVDETPGRRASDADFGRRLARLHAAGAPCFGRDDRRTTGSRGLPNVPTDTWAEFYASCRLLPIARLAADANALSAGAVAGLEMLAGRLCEFGGADEAPARLHGDLWAGNRLIDELGRSWLIDPAAHGGHRESDLAMMQLFGGWALDVVAAYDEIHPLADGWEDRVALHQLAPLAIHAIKFGGTYASATERAVLQYM